MHTWSGWEKVLKSTPKETPNFCLFSSSPSVATGVVVFAVYWASCASKFGCSATIVTIVASSVKSVLEFFVNFRWPRKKTVFTNGFPVLENTRNTSDYVRSSLSRAVSKTSLRAGAPGVTCHPGNRDLSGPTRIARRQVSLRPTLLSNVSSCLWEQEGNTWPEGSVTRALSSLSSQSSVGFGWPHVKANATGT